MEVEEVFNCSWDSGNITFHLKKTSSKVLDLLHASGVRTDGQMDSEISIGDQQKCEKLNLLSPMS
jgi:hypothetical protein